MKVTNKKVSSMHLARKYATAMFGVVVFVVFSILNENFCTFTNQMQLLRSMSMLTIVGLGFNFVFAAGGFDMSVGDIAGFINIMLGLLLTQGHSVLVSILACLAIGVVVGSINGTLVAVLGLPDFIATYAVGIVFYGIKMMITKGNPISLPHTNIPESFFYIGQGKIGGALPVPVIIMAVILALVIFVLKKTRLGRRIYAIGGNKVAAQYSGINVSKYRFITFMVSGLAVALASIMLTSRLGTAQPLGGTDFLMDAIASTYLSTTMFGEGEATPLGIFVGAYIISMLTNGLTMLNVEYYFQYITKGLVVILAVLTSAYYTKRMAKA